MPIRIKIIDVAVAVVLALPVGGFLWMFFSSGMTLGQRFAWGLFGFVAVIGDINVILPKLHNSEFTKPTIWGFLTVLGAMVLIRLVRSRRSSRERGHTVEGGEGPVDSTGRNRDRL